MSGKGSAPRPIPDRALYEAEWDRIFMGRGRVVQASGSNPDNAGSIPAAPAIYVDNATGQEVTEAWWPGDPIPEQG